MRDFRIDPYNRDYKLNAGQYELTNNIMNNIYLSLKIRRGTWPFNPGLGSRLHLLEREKSLERVAKKAKEYCIEALKWIIDAGRAESIDVTTELDKGKGRLNILIEAVQNGRPLVYETFIEVR